MEKSAYRYERKFTATAAHRSELISHIKNHPAFFREIYHTRQVNNIYFDTPALKFYNDNITGISQRKKVRIRWYGKTEGQIVSPKLEFKIKSGQVGTKWVLDMADFEMGRAFSKKYIFDILKKSDLPAAILEDIKILSPTLVNSYRRTYFLSSDQKYRLTFDEDLLFYRPPVLGNQPFCNPRSASNHFILELKYAQSEDARANYISKRFPFRLDKSSKYVKGLERVRG